MTDKEVRILEVMETYGGGFVKALAAAWKRADSGNHWKLRHAFANYWEQYEKLAESLPNSKPVR